MWLLAFIVSLSVVLGLWYAISWAAGWSERKFSDYDDENEN
jgi:hypothetical protein